MDWTHLPRSLIIVPVLALPASAQQSPLVTAPPAGGFVVMPEARPGPVPVPPPPNRPGLFNWRQRHAVHKSHLQEKVLGYPEEFNEWPLGRSLYALNQTQVANGAAARMILNHCDFVGDTTELNYRGRDKLAAIAAQLPSTFNPVIIERTPWAPEVAEARRLIIVERLVRGPFPVPAERVVIAPAIARGLSGAEAVIVDTNRLSSFASGGTISGGGGGGAPLGGAALGGAAGGISPLSIGR